MFGKMPPPLDDSCGAEQAHQWVEESCAAQGIPSKLCDLHVLRDVAVLFTVGRPIWPCSDLPDRCDPVGVELVAASNGRPDNDGVEQGGDDGTLASRGERIPLAS
jgi:hypothetical protein